MKLTKRQLNSVVRSYLLQESFLTSDVKSIESVKLGDLELQAIGYISIDDLNPNKFDHILVYSKKVDHQKIVKYTDRFKLLIDNFTYTVKNNERKSNHRIQLKNDMSAYAIPLTTPGLKKVESDLKTGEASMADWAIEALSLAGIVPVVGVPADIASAVLAIAKTPPDYVLATLSLILGIGVPVGLGYLARKPAEKAIKAAIKNASDPKEIGEAIASHISELPDNTFTDKSIELLEEEILDVLELIRDIDIETLPGLDESIEKAFQKNIDTLEDIIGNVSVSLKRAEPPLGTTPKQAKTLAKDANIVTKAVQEEMKKQLKQTSMNLLRRSLTEMSKDAGTILKEQKKEMSSFVEQYVGDENFMSGVLDSWYGHFFKGKTYQGVEYENYDQFKTAVETLSKFTGQNVEAIFKDFASKIANQGVPDNYYDFVDQKLIDRIVAQYLEKAKEIDFVFGDIPMGTNFSGGITKATAWFNPNTMTVKFPINEKELRQYTVTTTGPSGDPFAPDAKEAIVSGVRYFVKSSFNKEVIQHEFLHGLDRGLMIAISGGNDVLKAIAKGMNASDIIHKKYFPMEDSLDTIGEKMSKEFKNMPYFFVSTLKDYKTGKEAGKYLHDQFGFPEYFSDVLAATIRKDKFTIDTIKEIDGSFFRYEINPPEFYVRMQRLAEILKDNNVKLDDTKSVAKYFLENKNTSTELRAAGFFVKTMIDILENPKSYDEDLYKQTFKIVFDYIN